MPKLPPIRVDTYADLKQLLDKEQMKLEGSVSEQINSLNEAIRSLNGAYAFLGDPKNHPNLFPYNKRSAANAIKDVLKVLNPKFATLKALREKQLNFASRMLVPNDAGEYTSNGKFYIQFVNVGMGDCTLITTPKGIKIMVDCGSDALSDVTSLIPGYNPDTMGSAEQIIGQAINSKTFLNNSAAIDILVLCHPDGNHHNKFQSILQTIRNISVKIVCFGGADKLDAFSCNKYVEQIANCATWTSSSMTTRWMSKK